MRGSLAARAYPVPMRHVIPPLPAGSRAARTRATPVRRRAAGPDPRRRPPLRRAVVLLAIATLLQGCASVDYYAHLLAGQIRIWRSGVPLERALSSGTLPAETVRRLALAADARDFAFGTLGLPDHGSFREYVDLERDFVIWNVFATPELSLEPVQSCHPFVGCFSYRGFFDRARARAHAETLARSGHDVFVGGVSAYSTLGWLDDPVLSSILERGDLRIAEIVFHELAHERLYLPGDTAFNESFAMSVADAGLELWLPLHGGDPGAAAVLRRRHAAFVDMLMQARETLARRFAAAGNDAARRRAKRETYAELDEAYRRLREAWGGDGAYDAWMENDLNNAKLASVSTYHVHVDAFTRLLGELGGDFRAFYAAVEWLSELDEAARARCLEALGDTERRIPEGCGAGLLQTRP